MQAEASDQFPSRQLTYHEVSWVCRWQFWCWAKLTLLKKIILILIGVRLNRNGARRRTRCAGRHMLGEESGSEKGCPRPTRSSIQIRDSKTIVREEDRSCFGAGAAITKSKQEFLYGIVNKQFVEAAQNHGQKFDAHHHIASTIVEGFTLSKPKIWGVVYSRKSCTLTESQVWHWNCRQARKYVRWPYFLFFLTTIWSFQIFEGDKVFIHSHAGKCLDQSVNLPQVIHDFLLTTANLTILWDDNTSLHHPLKSMRVQSSTRLSHQSLSIDFNIQRWSRQNVWHYAQFILLLIFLLWTPQIERNIVPSIR